MAVGFLYRRIKNSLYTCGQDVARLPFGAPRIHVWTTFAWEKNEKLYMMRILGEEESRFSFLRRRITTDVIRATINTSCRNEAQTPRRIFGGRRLFGRRHASVKNLISPCTAVSATALDTGVSPPWTRTISALNSSFCRVRPDMCCRFRLVILKNFIHSANVSLLRSAA